MSKKEKIVYSNAVSIIILVVFLYTFLPFNTARASKEFKFDRIANEGYVAFIVNEQISTAPDDEEDEVQCDGSGFITHGDGHKTPCPGCSKCQRSQEPVEQVVESEDSPVDILTGRAIIDYVDRSKEEIKEMVQEVSDMRDEVYDIQKDVNKNAKYVEDLIVSKPIQNWDTPKEGIDPSKMIQSINLKPEVLQNMAIESKQIAMFTASWCPPCQRFKNEEVEKLRKAGWRVGTGPQSHIRIIDIEKDPATYQKWAKEAGTNTIPLFVLVKKGHFIESKKGFHSGVKIAEWYNAN